MKNTLITAILILGTILSSNSCKKYDKGGTMWNRKKKLLDHTWKLSRVESDVITNLDEWDNLLLTEDLELLFDKVDKGKATFNNTNSSNPKEIKDKFIFQFDSVNANSITIYNNTKSIFFDIIKLTKTNLILKTDLDNEYSKSNTTLYYEK